MATNTHTHEIAAHACRNGRGRRGLGVLATVALLSVAACGGGASGGGGTSGGGGGTDGGGTDGPQDGGAGPGASEVVGAAGGEISVAGATITVGAGALPEDVEITVQEEPTEVPEGHEAYSSVYHFEPSGLTFDAPVTVRIPYAGSEPAALFWSKDDGTGYEVIPSTVVDGALEGEVTHFSGGFVGHPLAGYWNGGTTESTCSGTGGSETGIRATLYNFTSTWLKVLDEEEVCGSCGEGAGSYCKTAEVSYAFDGSTISIHTPDGTLTGTYDPARPNEVALALPGAGSGVLTRRAQAVEAHDRCECVP